MKRFLAAFLDVLWGLPSISLVDTLKQLGCYDNSRPLDTADIDVVTRDIYLPPYRGDESVDDVTPLLYIIRCMSPSVVVELGTAYGNMTANICFNADEVTVYTVNALASQLSGDVVSEVLSKEDIGRVYRDCGFSDSVVQIYQNTRTLNLGVLLDGPIVDLAIIDACHDVGYVYRDFKKVARYICPGGVVLLHDTHPSGDDHLIGSYLACLWLRREGFDIRHIDGTWWAFWQRGGCVSD